MKINSTIHFITLLAILTFPVIDAVAQCPGGYTSAELNWDHIDFLPSNNTRYTSFYPNSAFPYDQNFTIGTRRVNFIMAPQGNITLDGENGTNTGHSGSFASAGDDVQFTTTSSSNTTISMTFDADVANVKFSLFDLDNSQRVTITAKNSANISQTITIAKASGSSAITIAGSGSTSAVATGPGPGYNNNDNRGTVNVTVAGPVSQVVLTLNNASGNIWLSDIDACVTGSFPNNYQQVSRPFTGQPQYVLTVVNNNVYYTDPANGKAYFLFNEPGHDRLNSMAYDPYRRIVYYTYSLTDRVGLNPQNDKTLKKYDVDAKTISVVSADVNSLGIPTYESGVESGAASFYNGSLYLGIEGYTSSNYAAGRKTTVWKIDFDVAGNPIYPAAQVWGITADNGSNSQNIHDWSDFGISNGVLYDFDGSGSGDIDYYHFDMMTGVETNYTPVGQVPRQVSIGWDEKIYNVDGDIALYNGTNSTGTQYAIYAPIGPTIPTGSAASWGDAAGPYRPFLDFGDAPASYDPDPLSPACHDTLTPLVGGTKRKMRLGADEDVEWLKKGLTSVEDTYEDGLAFVPIFSPLAGSYQAQVTVFNNTGSNATLCAWLDYNANGVFDASESIVPITVPSSGSTQSFWLNWPSTPSPLTFGSYTYLRIRITSASNGMNANNATGYYDMGEVEDYRVVVDNGVLSVTLHSFDASVENNARVLLAWSVNEEAGFLGYIVERSKNNTDWEQVGIVQATESGSHQYQLRDYMPYKGTSYYRIKINTAGGASEISDVKTVKLNDVAEFVKIFPNPASTTTTLSIETSNAGGAQIIIVNAKGATVFTDKRSLQKGLNTIELAVRNTWPAGTYFIQVNTIDAVMTTKLLVRK